MTSRVKLDEVESKQTLKALISLTKEGQEYEFFTHGAVHKREMDLFGHGMFQQNTAKIDAYFASVSKQGYVDRAMLTNSFQSTWGYRANLKKIAKDKLVEED